MHSIFNLDRILRDGIFIFLLVVAAMAPQRLQAQTKLALLVGVEKYERDGFKPLEFSEDDARDLKVELDKLGFQTDILIGNQATLAGLTSRLSTLYQKSKTLKQDDIVLVYLSGHGVQKRLKRKEEGKELVKEEPFFCPIDAHKNDPATMLSVNELIERLKQDSGASNNILLVDACRETSERGAKGLDGSTIEALPGKLALFFAAQSGSLSYESKKLGHGIFTYYLLEGLRGKAADEDQEVTLQGLASFVTKRVQKDSPSLLEVEESEAQKPNLIINRGGTLVLGKVAAVRPKEPTISPMDKKPPSPGNGSREKAVEGKSAGEVREANSLGMRMVWIPKGSFTMGSPESEAGHQEDETQVNVKLTQGFWLGETEVTQGEWTNLMGSSPWKGMGIVKDGLNYAATYVSAEDADAFVKKLNEQESRLGRLPAGWKYSLPTEAQWEYACRSGEPTAYHFGDDAGELGQYAWFDRNADTVGEEYAHEVRQKKANGWGLYDMHGNVFEWCRDSYNEKLPGGTDPFVSKGSDRVCRGGGWSLSASSCRSAVRYNDTPDGRSYNLGFRVALGR